MQRPQLLLTAMMGLALAGCPRNNPIECIDQTSCDLSPGGVCTVAPSGNQWCAYPDLTCPSGLRYGDRHVGDGLAGACVNEDVDAGVSDVTPPTISSHTPADLAADVPTGTAVTVTFSEAILASSVTSTTFSVRAGMVPVVGTLSVVGPDVSFVPTMRLSPGVEYTATVTTGVTDLAGNALQQQLRWTFHTGLGGWTPRQVLEGDVTHAATSLTVAFSANGRGVATWMMDRAYAAIYADGMWSQGAAITQASANRPIAAVIDSQGRATALLAGGGQLQAVQYSAGAWGAPLEIDNSAGNVGKAAVGTDDAGNVVAVWAQSEGAVPSIWSARYVAGGGWGAAALLESAAGATSAPSVVVLPDGSAVAVWAQPNMIYSAKMSVAGVWAAPSPVGAGGFSAPAVAAGPGGALIAVWSSGDLLQAARYSGAWAAPTTINTGTATPFTDSARIVITPSGKGIANWTAGSPGFQNLLHAVFAAGAWGPPRTIDVLAGAVNDQSLVAGGGDLALAGWSQPQGNTGAVTSGWSSLFGGATGWSEPQLFEQDESAHVAEVGTYYDAGINVFGVVWIQSQSGGLPSVFYSELR
jgi:hypothetical protein